MFGNGFAPARPAVFGHQRLEIGMRGSADRSAQVAVQFACLHSPCHDTALAMGVFNYARRFAPLLGEKSLAELSRGLDRLFFTPTLCLAGCLSQHYESRGGSILRVITFTLGIRLLRLARPPSALKLAFGAELREKEKSRLAMACCSALACVLRAATR